MIKVFDSNVTTFSTNGLGTINPLSCIETKRIGLGGWFVDIEANILYGSFIKQDNIILVDTKENAAQPFRIGNPDKKDRRISFRAYHVVFDAQRYVLDDVRPTSLGSVQYLTWCNDRTDKQSPFLISGDAVGTATHYFVRKTLLEAFEQAETDFGAIISPSNFQVAIMKHESVGSDSGMSVAYGKNIQGVRVTENWDDVCTKILPVGPNELLLPEKFLSGSTQYPQPYTKIVSFDVDQQNESGVDYTNDEKVAILRQKAVDYLSAHSLPAISYDVKADVSQDLHIGDTVHIKHPLVTISAKVQEYQYDVIRRWVKSLKFGNYDSSVATALASNISSQVQAATDASVKTVNKNMTAYAEQMMQVTDVIANGMGLFMTQEIGTNGGNITYLHNKPKKADSDILWAFFDGAFSVSTDGGTTWNAGIKADGTAVLNLLSVIKLNADWITAGTITAIDINGSKLKFGDDPNTVTVRTNDVKNGVLFEGAGVIDMNTNGAFTASNLDSSQREANSIRIGNTDAASDAAITNKFGGSLHNQIALHGEANYRSITIKNMTDLGRVANMLQLTHNPADYTSGTTTNKHGTWGFRL